MKPTFIIYGDCQASAFFEVIRKIPPVSEQFEIHQLPRPWDMSQPLPELRPDVWERCTLFWQQVGNERLPHDFFARVPSNARVQRFASVYFGPAWPLHQPDPVFRAEPEYPHGKFPYQDRRLVGLAVSGEDRDLYARYLEATESVSEQIDRALENSVRMMVQREAQCTVPVTGYIAAQFRTNRLLWTPFHPTSALLSVIFDRLVAASWAEEARNPGHIRSAGREIFSSFDPLDYDHFIVLPSVAASLGLTWWSEDFKYHCRPQRRYTVREYVEAYVTERRGRLAAAARGLPPENTPR